MPQIRYHDLRHSCATLLLAAGVDLKTLSTILGHTQISVTADYYGHVTAAMKRPALEQLNALLSQGFP